MRVSNDKKQKRRKILRSSTNNFQKHTWEGQVMTPKKIHENKPKYHSIFNRKKKEERESKQRNDKMF